MLSIYWGVTDDCCYYIDDEYQEAVELEWFNDPLVQNIIADIGGVILDDSNEVLEKFLNKSENEVKNLSKMVYGNPNWKKCLLGEITQEEHLQKLIEQFPKYQQNFEKMLMPEYQEFVLPVMKENLELL